MSSSSEATDLNLERAQEEQRLSAVPAEVIEILGRDVVLRLEALDNDLRWIDGVVKAENPFSKARTGEPDLSFLKPSAAKKVMDTYLADGPPEKVVGNISTHPLRLLRASMTFSRLNRLGTEANIACFDWIKEVSDSIRDLRSDDIDVDSQSGQRMTVEQIIDIKNKMDFMRDYAEQLPTDTTFEALKSVFKMSKAVLKAKLGHINQLALKTHADMFEEADKGVEKVDKTHDYLMIALKYGAKAYNVFQVELRPEVINFCLDLLVAAAGAKERLAEISHTLEEPQSAHIPIAESYVISKIAEAEKAFRQLSPDVIGNRAAAREMQRLLNPALSKAEKERIAQKEAEISRDLSVRVSLARDILRGGGRLETKNGDKPKEIAESLRQLFKENSFNEAGISYPQDSGLIIALITGKFDVFSRTISEIQTDEPNEALAIVGRNRAEIIEELRQFGLDGAMDKLRLLTENPQLVGSLKNVLSADQLIKLELSIEKYFEKQGNEKDTRTAYELEQVLGSEDLYARLDWTVLPAGEAELEKAAREIIDMVNERTFGESAEIDLERLNILKNIKDQWGADRCFYARGSLSGRQRVTVDGMEQPDEYIVLVLQSLDSQGNVEMEHAIAESPVAGHNALYIMRGDVTEYSWRDIFSLPKKDARTFGARAVKHTKGDGSGLVSSMTKKLKYLLSCGPEEFSILQFSGKYIKVAKNIGTLSTSS